MKKTHNPDLFRLALSRHASGVTAITTCYQGQKLGVTIGSFTSLSLDPPLVLFCLNNKARSLPAFKKGAAFAVNILDKKQKKLAQIFSAPGARDWADVAYVKGQKNVPLFSGSRAVLECAVAKTIKAGDHSIIIGAVKHIIAPDKKSSPLLYVERHYHRAEKF